MRWKRLSLTILALAAVAALGVLLPFPAPTSGDGEDASQGVSTSQPEGTGKANEDIGQKLQLPPPTPTPEQFTRNTGATSLQTDEDMSRPAAARSEEDVAWLRRHLYPTSEEIYAEALLTADNMPQTSREMAGAAAAIETEATREDAERSLINGAMMGSTYALVALGQFYQLRDPVLSQAYLRAAIMRGDWIISFWPKPSLHSNQDALASMMALQLLENFDQQRALRGLPPMRREIRPGLPSFIDALRMTIEDMANLPKDED